MFDTDRHSQLVNAVFARAPVVPVITIDRLEDALPLCRALVEPEPLDGTSLEAVLDPLFSQWIPRSFGTPGPGYLHVPSWVNRAFLDELYRSETRNKDGVWQQVRKRNEAFDLAVYVRAGCLRLGVDKIKSWDRAPAWAQPLASNREVITREARREMKEELAELPLPEKPATPSQAGARQ